MLGKSLDLILGQTEKYSKMLAKNLAGPEGATGQGALLLPAPAPAPTATTAAAAAAAAETGVTVGVTRRHSSLATRIALLNLSNV